jgi:hypothetical protein
MSLLRYINNSSPEKSSLYSVYTENHKHIGNTGIPVFLLRTKHTVFAEHNPEFTPDQGDPPFFVYVFDINTPILNNVLYMRSENRGQEISLC